MSEASSKEKQRYLDAAFHFTRFVYAAETRIGAVVNEGMVDYWGTAGPILYRMLLPLRDMLDELARDLKELPGFEPRPGVLLVEGQTERAFLTKLAESGVSWFVDLHIDVYAGRGNRRPGRIEMLLNRYLNDGYRVFMEGDADGKDITHVFEGLIQKGLAAPERVFVFEHDFESSVPPRLLHASLRSMNLLGDVNADEFAQNAQTWHSSILQMLKDCYGMTIDAQKVELASTVADLLNAQSWDRDDAFMSSELGRFLAFIRHVR